MQYFRVICLKGHRIILITGPCHTGLIIQNPSRSTTASGSDSHTLSVSTKMSSEAERSSLSSVGFAFGDLRSPPTQDNGPARVQKGSARYASLSRRIRPDPENPGKPSDPNSAHSYTSTNPSSGQARDTHEMDPYISEGAFV